jgi:hypothetical protein
MKTVMGWWFAPKNKRLAHNDGRKIKIGATHKVDGPIIPCQKGLHLSKRLIDALQYAPGPVVYRVQGSGIIKPHGNPVDKYACSERTYIKGGIDASDTLFKFARLCALDVIHLWDAPDVVIEFLKTGKKELAADAYAPAAAAYAYAPAAAYAAATHATHAAYTAAAATHAAAYTAARAAASAADAAARAAGAADAYTAAKTKQNSRLTSMIVNTIKSQEKHGHG